MIPGSASALGALSSHRFLMRAAFTATTAFAWVFLLQYYYGYHHDLRVAFVSVIMLYALVQVITALVTPYSAVRISAGVKRLMVFGVAFACMALAFLGAAIAGAVSPAIGIVGFAVFMGGYRALYWVPFALEKQQARIKSGYIQESLLALMPLIAGFSLFDGALGALSLLIAGMIILIGSLFPLIAMPEFYERFSWSYRNTFGELFEAKYNPVVEAAFLEGLQGTALLLLWPLSVFVLVGSSYVALGFMLSLTLLLAIPLRAFGQKLVHGRPLLHATMTVSAWVMRLTVATPVGVVLVDAFAATSRKGTPDLHALEQAADNFTYVDEITAVKELSLAIGRLSMCAVAAICISYFSLAAGLAVSFVIAGLAAVISVVEARKVRDF